MISSPRSIGPSTITVFPDAIRQCTGTWSSAAPGSSDLAEQLAPPVRLVGQRGLGVGGDGEPDRGDAGVGVCGEDVGEDLLGGPVVGRGVEAAVRGDGEEVVLGGGRHGGILQVVFSFVVAWRTSFHSRTRWRPTTPWRRKGFSSGGLETAQRHPRPWLGRAIR